MGLADVLRALLPGHENESTQGETFNYRCRNCDRAFESTHRHVVTASCPACGSDDVRVCEDPY